MRGLFVVADGISRAPAGDVAAQLVVDLLPKILSRPLGGGSESIRAFGKSLGDLSDELHARSRADMRFAGLGAAVVAMRVTGRWAQIAHLGDSRGYLWRDGRLRQLTVDHVLTQALVEAGEIGESEAQAHPSRHVLTRYAGMDPPALPGVDAVELVRGDRILLCSDGLHGMLADHDLANLLRAQTDPDAACVALVDAANCAGGHDNITAVVVDISAA